MARTNDATGQQTAPRRLTTRPAEPEAQERTWRALLRQFRPAIVLTLVLTHHHRH